MSASYTLPWPPSINAYYVNGYNHKRHVTKVAMAFRANVQAVVLSHGVPPRVQADIKLTILASPPDDKRKHDLDNIVKSTQDALQHAGVYLDDHQIDELHVIRQKRSGTGFIEVEIEQLAERIES